MTERASIDPVTFEVIWHRLLDITEEMGIKYMRTSGSPVLVGAYDASTAITLPDGRLVAMGPYITTQGHVQRLIIEATTRMRARAGIGDGDMFICNDPYLGATHQPDVVTVGHVGYDGNPAAWVGSSGHWLDIGGPEPGGFAVSAQSVFDEGLRLPPTKIADGGRGREDVVDLIMNQVRDPLVELDMRGQMVANQWGRQRLHEVFGEFGLETVTGVMEEAISYVGRRIRSRLEELPDGVWREVQFLDHDGQKRNVRKIVLTATKRGGKLTLDFTGSDPQAAGFANCAYGGLRASCLSAVGISLGFDVPWNDGLAECVEIIAPPKTIVTAEYPNAVSLATISAIIVTLNLVVGTLSKMLLSSDTYRAEAMAGWCGTSLGVSLLAERTDGSLTLFAEGSHFAAGCGARTYDDGVDTGGIIINTTASIPSIELTESEYPFLYLFRRQLTDSGGAGRYRGGLSGSLAVTPYGDVRSVESTFAGAGAEVANGYGLAGGLPGATVRYARVTHGGDAAERLGWPEPSGDLRAVEGLEVGEVNTSHRPLALTDIEFHNWQGGGGFGDPIEREPDRVVADVRAGWVSREAAASTYGVVLGGDVVDERATERRRAEIRDARIAGARPAAEVIQDDPAWSAAIGWMADAGQVGVLAYGDSVVIDHGRGTITCAACGTGLGASTDDFRLHALVDEGPLHEIGSVRGVEYADGSVLIRRYYCPGCARQLEAEVTSPGAPRAAAVMTAPVSVDADAAA